MLPEQDNFIEGLYHSAYPQLLARAKRLLGDGERAKDVVQDTFHEAVRRVDVLMFHPNPVGWLHVVLFNKIRESERARQRYLRRFFSLDSPWTEEPGEEDHRFRRAEEGDPLEQIQAALTPEEFTLLTRLTLDKASHLEVARELNISVYASRKRLERIRDKLAELFPERRKK